MENSTYAADAASLAERGFAVFPGKAKGGHRNASTDPATVRRTFEANMGQPVAILAGPKQGLTIVDVDGPEGRAKLQYLTDILGPLAGKATVSTGGGGLHYYATFARLAPDARKGSLSGSASPTGGGIDLIGCGGSNAAAWAFAPPSDMRAGPHAKDGHTRPYAWQGTPPDAASLSKIPEPWVRAFRALAADNAPDGIIPPFDPRLDDIQPGGRNDTIFHAARWWRWYGFDAAIVERAANVLAGRCGYREAKLKATVASVLAGQVSTKGPGGSLGDLMADNRKRPHTPEGLAEALEDAGMDLRYNARRGAVEWKDAERGWLVHFDEAADAGVRWKLRELSRTDHKDGFFIATDQRWRTVVNGLADTRRFDPFAEYLGRLKWDGTPRIADALHTAFAVDPDMDPTLCRFISRWLFVAAVERTLTPGTNIPLMPIIGGGQASGKSTFLEALPPPDVPGLFSDCLALDDSTQRQLEAVGGAVIVEAGEMAGYSKASLERWKALVSRNVDRLRKPYAAQPSELPRRFLLAGTTNADRPLPNDASGARRFVHVPVERGNVGPPAQWLDANRDQLWAEAMAVFDVGGRAMDGFEELAEARADNYAAGRDSDEVVEAALSEWLAECGDDDFSIPEAVEAVKVRLAAPVSARRTGKALRQLGFRPVQLRLLDGTRPRVWRRESQLSAA